MAKTELDRQIAKAVATVRRREVFDRIIALLRHYNAEHLEQHFDHTQVKGRLVLHIGGGRTEFFEDSWGQFHEYLTVKVLYGGILMFEATNGLHATSDGVDPRRVIRRKNGVIVVDHFTPGLWMKLLNLRWLIRRDEAVKRRKEHELNRALSHPPKPQPPREDDSVMAARFGIKT